MDFSLIIPTIIEWWPLFFASAVLWVVGQQIKKVIPKPETSFFWRYFWMTLPLHPIVAGIVFGLLPFAPVPISIKSIGGASGSLFYAGSGVLAVVGRDIIQTIIKYKFKSD